MSNEPYRPPVSQEPTAVSSRAWPAVFVWGFAMWSLLAATLLLTHLFVKPVFVDFELELPVLTRCLMHPMAVFASCVISVAVLLTGTWTENETLRKRTGRLALVFGIIAWIAMFLGIVLPGISLINALS